MWQRGATCADGRLARNGLGRNGLGRIYRDYPAADLNSAHYGLPHDHCSTGRNLEHDKRPHNDSW